MKGFAQFADLAADPPVLTFAAADESAAAFFTLEGAAASSLVPNGDFNDATGHSKVHVTIDGGQCFFDGGNFTQSDTVTSSETLTSGVYLVVIGIADTDGAGPVSAVVGGTVAEFADSQTPGIKTVFVTVETVSGQLLTILSHITAAALDFWAVYRMP